MKIVINISEDVYTRLFDNGIQDNEIAVDDVCEMARAIRLGTTLPWSTTEQKKSEIEEIDILKKDLKGRQKKIEKLIVSCARYKYKAGHYEELHSRMCKDNIILSGELAYYKQLLDFYKKDRYEWIYINEKKPDDGDWCIFTNGSKVSVERYKEDAIDHFYPEGRWFSLDDVIAWIPLPELPYKEDKDERRPDNNIRT